MNDGFVEFGNLCGATGQTTLDRNFPALSVSINKDTVGRLAHFTLFTADHGETKKFLVLNLKRLSSEAGPAMCDLFLMNAAHPIAELLLELLQLCFAVGTVDLVETAARVRVGFRMAYVPAFGNPTVEFRGVKKAIAAINHCRRHAVLEFQITGIGT